MTLSSTLKYWWHVRCASRGKTRARTLRLALTSPIRGVVTIRTWGSDLATMKENVIENVYADIVTYLPTCHTILDIGANVGFSTLFFATSFPDATIISVEPDPDNYNLLKQNVAPIVSAGRCCTYHAAAWHSPGEVQLTDASSDGRFASVRVTESRGDVARLATAMKIGDILDDAGLDSVDLVKMDAEGAERELFKREHASWLARVGAVAAEFHADAREASDADNVLAEFGFRILSENHHTVLAVRPTHNRWRTATWNNLPEQ